MGYPHSTRSSMAHRPATGATWMRVRVGN